MNRRDIRHYLKLSGKIILDGIYPRGCVVCGGPLEFDKRDHPERTHEECREFLKPVDGPVCCKCGKKINADETRCSDCNGTERIFDGAVSVFEYNNAIKESIYRFKYKNKREYASAFAYMIAKNKKRIIEHWQPDVVIPVPMHPDKKKLRGYDQAEILAKETADIFRIRMEGDTLVRRKQTVPQKELGTKKRYINLEGAFEARKSLKGKKVLLIDDIYTTGATFDSCAHVLKRAGADKVYGASLCIGRGM